MTCPILMSGPVVSIEVLVIGYSEAAAFTLTLDRAFMKFCVLTSGGFS